MSNESASPHRLRMRAYQIVVALAVLVLVTAGAALLTYLLLGVPSDAPLGDRVKALQAALAVGVSGGGVLTLASVGHRQWVQHKTIETELARTEDARVAARRLEEDATLRRIIDLRLRAVDQLGSRSAPVRLGGVHSLGDLAKRHADRRHEVLDILCAYLRSPFIPPEMLSNEYLRTQVALAREHAVISTASSDVDNATLLAEMGVRKTIQDLVLLLIDKNLDDVPSYPLDLSDAVLWDFTMVARRVHHASFNRAVFLGGSLFADSHFEAGADFVLSHFIGHANFQECAFGPDEASAKVNAIRARFFDAVWIDLDIRCDLHLAMQRDTPTVTQLPMGWTTGPAVDGWVPFRRPRPGEQTGDLEWPPANEIWDD